MTGEARTDGPSLSWRLELAGASLSRPEWRMLSDSVEPSSDPWVELHDALALAGGGEIVSSGSVGSTRISSPPERMG